MAPQDEKSRKELASPCKAGAHSQVQHIFGFKCFSCVLQMENLLFFFLMNSIFRSFMRGRATHLN